MKLTSYSNYTLRVLMIAAVRFPALTTIGELAAAFAISKTHLVKCVHQLGTWGYIETVRGNGGGFRLARPANAISIGEIMRRTEEGFDLAECFREETNTCPLIARCRLRPALQRATVAFLDTLDAITLEEVASNGDDLLKILELTAPSCREAKISA
ncbi:Rrf2 family transcriptional regulator [Rhodoblastus acidophilus]|uniref:Rrf2 family transcriptional regulator n=1 Tax=Rhodoblastus acidophilus TaxID=1074 RepID=A0A6N8DH78_RHOAC|nr:Rrf2 family transcriptional regulator [Rhodoblastus acidophilus]MCW2272789.1 Rrf2 family nitric oxide-sensitive transcriptional repressor [Rhodoblastus acidophilus]MTV29700.1 Rrf2 family transcriptional regulator [Rhodoblastus acidophilus]